MRDLILSDIHANWEGLMAVLEFARGQYDRIICCGDVVGYGANPNEVVAWVRENAAAVIRGNHDKVAAGLESSDDFNPLAKRAALWTINTLSPESHAWVRSLPAGPADVDGYQIVHGSPYDEDEYLLDQFEVRRAMDVADGQLTFFGHTHIQGGFCTHHGRIIVLPPPRADESAYSIELEPDDRYLVNPGSTGQPRDGDWRAGAAIYDQEARLVTLLRVPYDVKTAQRKICDAGLPVPLALRLATGS